MNGAQLYRSRVGSAGGRLIAIYLLIAIGEEALLFWRDEADQAIDGVGSAILHGVIMTHLQLSEQADSEQLNAGDDEDRSDNEQRTVLIHEALVGMDNLENE